MFAPVNVRTAFSATDALLVMTMLPAPTEVMNAPAGMPVPMTSMPGASPAVEATLIVVVEDAAVASVARWLVFCVRISEPTLRLTPPLNVLPENVSALVPAVTPVPVVMVIVFPEIKAMDSPAGMPVPVTSIPTESPAVLGTVNVAVAAVVVVVCPMVGVRINAPGPVFTSAPEGTMGAVISSPSGETPEVLMVPLGSTRTEFVPLTVGVKEKLSFTTVMPLVSVRTPLVPSATVGAELPPVLLMVILPSVFAPKRLNVPEPLMVTLLVLTIWPAVPKVRGTEVPAA